MPYTSKENEREGTEKVMSQQEKTNHVWKEGNCGSGDVYWKMDEEGNMTVFGTGDRMEYIHKYWDGEDWWTDPTSIDGVWDKVLTLCFEEGITEISNLFCGCENLERVSFPDSLERIAGFAFSGCKKLKSVVIPESVRQIGDQAFWGCGELKEVVCESGLIQFGSHVFDGTPWLESQNDFVILGNVLLGYRGIGPAITIPECVNDVVEYAFCQNSYIEEVIWSARVKHVPSNCFLQCEKLVSVDLPEGVTKIESYAFCECRQLLHVDLPESLTVISVKAFSDCTGLQEIRLPDNLERLDSDAFSKCKALKSIRIPKKITTLQGTFQGCTSLSEVTLGENVKTIWGYTFGECENLTEVHFPQNMPEIKAFAFQKTPIMKLMNFEPEFVIEEDVLEEYRGHDQKVVVPSGVKTIDNFAFAYCDEVEEVVLPDGVETIKEFAFRNGIKYARG